MVTYCGNFAIYVCEVIMLYTLNLYSDIYYLFFNKTGGGAQNLNLGLRSLSFFDCKIGI